VVPVLPPEEVLSEDVPLDGAVVPEDVVPPEVVVVPDDDELVPLVGAACGPVVISTLLKSAVIVSAAGPR
jgi:hypothetical protein